MSGAVPRPLSPFLVLAVLATALVLLGVTVWLEALLVGLVTHSSAAAALTRVTHDPGALALAQLVGLGVPLLFASRLLSDGTRRFFVSALAPCPWDRVALAFVAGLALQLPMVEIAHVVADVAPALRRSAVEEAALRETLAIHDLYTLLTVPLALVVLAPVTEELLFRAFAQRELGRAATRLHVGRPLVVASVALLFALFHMDPAGLPSILVAGLALGALAERWQSVRITIALHAGVNLVPVAIPESVVRIRGFNDPDPDAHVSAALVAVSALVFVGAYTLAWRGAREDLLRTARPG